MFSDIGNKFTRLNNFCITEDTFDECKDYPERINQIKLKGIEILNIEKKHLEKLKDILNFHGSNLKLIRLYSGEGKADVGILAYILAERDNPATLFPEEYILITNDTTLSDIAKGYNIKCISNLPED